MNCVCCGLHSYARAAARARVLSAKYGPQTGTMLSAHVSALIST